MVSVPISYLEQISLHCPNSLHLYVTLWNSQNEDGIVQVNKKCIKQDFLMSPTVFENRLIPLVREGLVSARTDNPYISIELTGWTD